MKTIFDDRNTFVCKALDLSDLPLAKLGDQVTVTVRYTHQELTKTQIDNWLSLYGTLSGDSR